MRFRWLFLFGLLATSPAYAQTFSALTVTSCGGQSLTTNQFYPVTMDLTGKLCDGASGGLSITGNVGGFDTGSAPAIAAGATKTPANSSHTAGKVVGGLFALPVARINGGSGAISRLFGFSVAGDTPTLLARIWDTSPANTTCTDNSNFVGSATDDLHLITQPFTITPAAPASTQGDAKTYFENDFIPPASFKNQDTSPAQLIYVCLTATATFTPGAGAYSLDATGYQN